MLLPGYTECHLGTSGVVMTRGDPGTEWVGIRDAARHPAVPRTAPKAAEPVEGAESIRVDNRGPVVAPAGDT